MDRIDKKFVEYYKVWPHNKWINLAEVDEEDISLFLSYIMVFKKRNYLDTRSFGNPDDLYEKSYYGLLTKDPLTRLQVSFKLFSMEQISEYYSKHRNYLPGFINHKQLKLDLDGKQGQLTIPFEDRQ